MVPLPAVVLAAVLASKWVTGLLLIMPPRWWRCCWDGRTAGSAPWRLIAALLGTPALVSLPRRALAADGRVTGAAASCWHSGAAAECPGADFAAG